MIAGPLGIAYVERMVLGTGLLGLAFGATLLAGAYATYRVPIVVLGAFLVSGLALVLLVKRAQRRGGTLDRRDSVWLAVVLVLVDVAVGVSLPEGEARVGTAVWSIGTGALLVLGMAAYRPAREVHGLAALHATTVLLVAAGPWVERWPPAAGLWQAVLAGVLPALAATRFLADYATGLRLRDASVAERLEAEAARRAQERSTVESAQRLAALDDRIRPLLSKVAAAQPLTSEDRELARELSRRLREELVEAASTSWLALAVADVGGQRRVLVADGADLAGRADVQSQTALSTVVLAAARCADGQGSTARVRVALSQAGPDVAACAISMPAEVLDRMLQTDGVRVAVATLDGVVRRDGDTAMIEGRVRLRARARTGGS